MLKKKTIYLDNGSTTKPDKEVVKAMNNMLSENYGNASSFHHKGLSAKTNLETARKIIAKNLNAEKEEIIFTSGGTESNNLAIKGVAQEHKEKGKHIITTKIEHDSVFNTCKELEKQGFKVSYLNVNEEGYISLEELKKKIKKDTILVTIIHGNHEIGTIQNLEEIYEMCKQKRIILHTDACQSYMKTALNKDFADLISINAHKIHGPKGIGALYIKKGIKIKPLQQGGGQEKNIRSGTENTPGIIGFSKAKITKKEIKKMKDLKEYFIKNALKIPDSKLNGSRKGLCNNINLSFKYIEGESIIALLNEEKICASTGSACSSKSLDPSRIIMAISNDVERAHSSIRFTISKHTTKKEIDYAIKKLRETIKYLRKISPLR